MGDGTFAESVWLFRKCCPYEQQNQFLFVSSSSFSFSFFFLVLFGEVGLRINLIISTWLHMQNIQLFVEVKNYLNMSDTTKSST